MSNNTQTPDAVYLDKMADTLDAIMRYLVAPGMMVRPASVATPGRETYVIMAQNQDSVEMFEIMEKLDFDYVSVQNGLTDYIKHYTFGRDYTPFVPDSE